MIDLSTWNLTIPTEPTPQVITTQQLNNGYQSRYFQQGNDGGLVFWVPIDGSHTEDSTYPRTELRETQADGSLDNWYYWQADNELRVTMSVEKVPSKNKVIIGQIHSKSPQTDDGEPLVKLQYYYKPEEGLGRVERWYATTRTIPIAATCRSSSRYAWASASTTACASPPAASWRCARAARTAKRTLTTRPSAAPGTTSCSISRPAPT